MTPLVWVVGARGLLGSAVTRDARRREGWELLDLPPLPWGDRPALARRAAEAAGLLADASRRGRVWCVVWAAGAGVTGSTAEQLEREREDLALVLEELSAALGDVAGREDGVVVYASSAGGVYGGSSQPPFDEATPPVPLSPYGRFKLDCERTVAASVAGLGARAVLARIANLYGPGQRLDKMQGVISHLALAQYSPDPATIYVSLDTMRDYVFVDDAAAMLLDSLALAAAEPPGTSTVKIVSSGSPATLATLLGQLRLLSKGRPNVRTGSSAAARFQGADIRLRSRVWPELDDRAFLPLPAGVKATMDDILGRIQSSRR